MGLEHREGCWSTCFMNGFDESNAGAGRSRQGRPLPPWGPGSARGRKEGERSLLVLSGVSRSVSRRRGTR